MISNDAPCAVTEAAMWRRGNSPPPTAALAARQRPAAILEGVARLTPERDDEMLSNREDYLVSPTITISRKE